MPQQTAQEVIEAQRQDWNRVAAGWEKWDEFFDRSLAFLNHRLVGDARLRPGHHVLDLGSGTGYPALLAAQVVGPRGRVIGIDLAEQMLAVAERKAARLGLTNIAFRTGDATTLPFDMASFDAVTSRFCLMFLPDIPRAAAEIARVLKPGGWVAAAVWSDPDKNASFGITMDVLKQLVELPPPDPDAPGLFRLARRGELSGMFRQAGLIDVADDEFLAELTYGSAEEYYRSLMDLAAPLQNLFAKLSPAQQSEAERRIVRAANEHRRGETIVLPIAVRLVVGRKPL